MSKVLVVGWDGATFDIIQPLIAEGKLPHFAALMQRGAWGTLRSTIPPVTPAAWTTFFTGKNPGKHGIYDFQELNPETYEFKTVRTDRHREKTLWQLLGEAGKRSLILDVPFTYPPKPFDGLMLTGYGTPRTEGTVFTHPPDLARLVPEHLRSEIRVALPTHRFDRSMGFIEEWQEVMAGRRRLLQHMIVHEPWDLFMVVFSITDNMAHVFWTYLDPAHPNYHKADGATFRKAFLDAYIDCDAQLGELVQAAGPESTTIVLSDHGFGSVRPRQYVFDRLMKGGYLQAAAGQKNNLRNRMMRLAADTYMRFPLLREWVKGLRPDQRKSVVQTFRRASLMPTQALEKLQSKVVINNFGLRMWIHDSERFSRGLVHPAEKDALIGELIEFLKADRDPVSGLPVIANVYQGHELYHGPFAERGPDLVIEYTNHFQPLNPQTGKNPFLEGGHTLEGIFLAQGGGIRPYRIEEPVSLNQLPTPTLADLTPTILYLFGQPIPPDMDGRVLTEIFHPDEITSHPVQEGDTPARHSEIGPGQDYTPEEEAEVEEQLRRLGYIS